MKTTNITTNELNLLSDEQFLNHLRQFPYKSQWTDGSVFDRVLHYLVHLQGKQYNKTGSLNSFKRWC